MLIAVGAAVSSFPNQNVGVHAGYPEIVAVVGWLTPLPSGLLISRVVGLDTRPTAKVPLYPEENPPIVTILPGPNLCEYPPLAGTAVQFIETLPFDVVAVGV